MITEIAEIKNFKTTEEGSLSNNVTVHLGRRVGEMKHSPIEYEGSV